jgi:protein-disulfide isomerase
MLRDLTQSLKELRQLEQSRQPLDHDVAARIAASDAPSFGDSDAKVTVVLFSDYDCKSCLPVGHYVPLLSQHYGPKELRVVFRQYPVSGGKFSRLSAESSLAAAAQKRFLPYHECLYNNQHDLNPASIERCAQESKLERSRFQAEMQEHRYEPQVSSDLTLGREALVGVVPYLFVNGQRFNGTRGVEDLRKLIDESLAQSASTNAVAATAQPKPAEVY